jgi:hypothetical protein
MTKPRSKAISNKLEASTWIRAIVCLFFIGYGILLFGSQILHFLQQGNWEEHSLLTFALKSHNKLARWLISPESWFGLHQILYWILDFIPLALTSFGIGFFILIAEDV